MSTYLKLKLRSSLMPLSVTIIPELKSLSRDNKHCLVCLLFFNYWYWYKTYSNLKQLLFVWLRQ